MRPALECVRQNSSFGGGVPPGRPDASAEIVSKLEIGVWKVRKTPSKHPRHQKERAISQMWNEFS
jgi:hypothetical protein